MLQSICCTTKINESCRKFSSRWSIQDKKLVSKLDLTAQKIDYYINDCMLYYKNNEGETECHFYGAPRFKPQSRKQRKQKDVSYKKLFYLPLIPHL